MRKTLLSIALIVAASPLFAAAPTPTDYAADARSIETLVNDNYAYLDRLPGGRMPMSDKLRAEAAAVGSRDALVRYAERALTLLADHHAITGSSLKDSWGLVPSYADLWVEKKGAAYVVSAVRPDTPAAKAGVAIGDRLTSVGGVPIDVAVAGFWSDLGVGMTPERGAYAARVLAAGRRSEPRKLGIASAAGDRVLDLPNLYYRDLLDRPVLNASEEGGALLIKLNDSLGNDRTIPAFDTAMARAKPGQRIIIDLTDTASGGNTSVARAMLGWFVSKPMPYQVHNLPAEERQTGIPRQWIEQVLPRAGKLHRGPVTIRVGRWTGSMGEGLAIGFDAIGARVEGDRMAGLLGAVYDYPLEKSGLVIKFPTERLFHVNGTPREKFVPKLTR